MKTYVKPELMLEDFQLNMSFAACDTVTRTIRDAANCYVTDLTGMKLFIDGGNCDYYEVYCDYNGGSGNYFGS